MSKDVTGVRSTLPFLICHLIFNSLTSPWPFTLWGMDIVGPLSVASMQKKFLLVDTDYFSKWVEVEAYASIKDKDICKFA